MVDWWWSAVGQLVNAGSWSYGRIAIERIVNHLFIFGIGICRTLQPQLIAVCCLVSWLFVQLLNYAPEIIFWLYECVGMLLYHRLTQHSQYIATGCVCSLLIYRKSRAFQLFDQEKRMGNSEKNRRDNYILLEQIEWKSSHCVRNISIWLNSLLHTHSPWRWCTPLSITE